MSCNLALHSVQNSLFIITLKSHVRSISNESCELTDKELKLSHDLEGNQDVYTMQPFGDKIESCKCERLCY